MTEKLEKRGGARPGSGRPRNEIPDTRVSIRLNAEELAKLDRLVSRYHTTRSEVFRKLLAAATASAARYCLAQNIPLPERK